MSLYKENFAGIVWNSRPVVRTVRPVSVNRADFPTPRVSGDFDPYDCPITGRTIEGRVAHAENLKRHDCRILEPGERADNTRNGQLAVEAEDKKRDAAIDGIVDAVANEYL
tara:strand:- start:1236 stop:1568 length:333 start_codon:yes stop_codon:yes gene_type:complete